ncbi:cobalamin binding intrinsic factor isoform X2 [Rhineura floridana]|uniref:cobalamin binding intrinsic factor isoform X2 n=1 Tax=Rhineura floridana TaxID=261503 RepID=UPI002AC81034|nr:cobalamin binding intrinsic factor isoform X2 [Rhineura floridana]
MRPLLGLVFLLLIQGCLACGVSEEQRPLVTDLLNKMIQSATAPESLPNPSVLLALRLARDHNLSFEQRLLKRLTDDAVDRVKTGKTFTSGQVALYALAHRASCSDPRKVSTADFELDLMKLLEKKFAMELENIKIHGNSLTNYYQLSLCVLALCQLQGTFSPSQTADLLIPDNKKYYLGGHFSVDIAAVAVLAQNCVQTTDNIPPKANRTITANIQWLLKKILEQKSSNGIIGNMYSTGEAMQALSVSDNYLTPTSWNCSQTLATVLADIPKGTFDNPMAAAQLFPSLEGRTYLDVSTINCSKDEVTNADSISPGTCSVPDSQQWLVTGLQTLLVDSVNQHSSPDPSVLIALNLAEDQDLNVRKQLVEEIKKTAIKEMTSGKVALYVLALRSSCENPNDVATPEKIVNLLHVLEEKTKEEINYLHDYGTPKTTYYQLALDTLALCVEKSPDVELAAVILAKAALANDFQSWGYFSVDTAAMTSLALSCVYDGIIAVQQNKLVGAIQEALAMITKQILGSQQSNGIIGNLYSTGLAMQALNITTEFYIAGAWSCMKTLDKVLNEVYLGAFNNPGTVSQILPSLVGKTYLDVRDLTCSSENIPTITVRYTIINDLIGPYFKYSITVNVPKGSVLLAVLETAQRAKPSEFSFQTEQTSWGPMVISIHGINASTDDKTYWQFLSGKTPLEQGVGSYKPVDNEQIVAVFSKY